MKPPSYARRIGVGKSENYGLKLDGWGSGMQSISHRLYIDILIEPQLRKQRTQDYPTPLHDI